MKCLLWVWLGRPAHTAIAGSSANVSLLFCCSLICFVPLFAIDNPVGGILLVAGLSSDADCFCCWCQSIQKQSRLLWSRWLHDAPAMFIRPYLRQFLRTPDHKFVLSIFYLCALGTRSGSMYVQNNVRIGSRRRRKCIQKQNTYVSCF